VFARDEAGNEASVPLEHRTFPAPLGRSRIELTDGFLSRVVPAVLAHAPDLGVSGDDPLAAYLAINGELRRRNADQIAQLAAKTSTDMLWRRPFQQLGHSQVEARFADHRTYHYKGGSRSAGAPGFDLAVTANVPVRAANRRTVVCRRSRHLWQHRHRRSRHGRSVALCTPVVDRREAGDAVDTGQDRLQRRTGLAAGDHLHFVLVGGRMVSPVEWWDPHWSRTGPAEAARSAAQPHRRTPRTL
jgi:hypothetical protein